MLLLCMTQVPLLLTVKRRETVFSNFSPNDVSSGKQRIVQTTSTPGQRCLVCVTRFKYSFPVVLITYQRYFRTCHLVMGVNICTRSWINLPEDVTAVVLNTAET